MDVQAEKEKVLQHPAIAEVAILGMPDPVWGETGVAVCVLREAAVLTGATLLAWLEPQVTRYKLPKQVVFWDALPKSAYGKITKKLIRAELEARAGLPSAAAGDVLNLDRGEPGRQTPAGHELSL